MTIRRATAVRCAALLLVAGAVPSTLAATAGGAGAATAPRTPGVPLSWHVTPTGSSDEFRGLSAVSHRVAWVSGETGTVLKTTDRGATWQDVSPPEAAGLALRDIEAFDAMHAVVLSIGKGKHSSIFTTDDGGATWTRTFTNRNRNAFYDCMAFSADGIGLAVSDPVNGRFRLAVSYNRGHNWNLLTPLHMPPALDGEFGFAASGTCIVAGPQHQFWIGSGGVAHPRVFSTSDAGLHWTVTRTPLRGGPTAGIYSLDFRGSRHGIAVGGDFLRPNAGAHASGVTYDGGRNWVRSGRPVAGYRSGVAWVSTKLAVAVGPTGSDLSRSGGVRWYHFDDARYDSIDCARDGGCWGSGTEGRVATLRY